MANEKPRQNTYYNRKRLILLVYKGYLQINMEKITIYGES